MQIGILFPQTEIGNDPAGIRDFAQAVKESGFDHLITYEHVLGAVPARLPKGYAPYNIDDPFHEVFTLFAFLAAAAPGLELATGILVLPQRQTTLVAKQAAQIDLFTGGRFRLGIGIGWNAAEFEGMGEKFSTRAPRMEEQIALLRTLWREEVVNFEGDFHTVRGLGIKPLPKETIPIWIGGGAEPALKRAAQLGDGFFPLKPLEGGWQSTFDRMREWRDQAALPWEGFGIEARVTANDGWEKEVEQWRDLGATHLSLSTMGRGLSGPGEHIAALRELTGVLHH